MRSMVEERRHGNVNIYVNPAQADQCKSVFSFVNVGAILSKINMLLLFSTKLGNISEICGYMFGISFFSGILKNIILLLSYLTPGLISKQSYALEVNYFIPEFSPLL